MNEVLKDDLDLNCNYHNHFVHYLPRNLCDSIELSFDSPFSLTNFELRKGFGYMFSCKDASSTQVLEFYIGVDYRDSIIDYYNKEIVILDHNLLIHSYSNNYFYYSTIDTSRGVSYSHSYTSEFYGKPAYLTVIKLYPSLENHNAVLYIFVNSITSQYGEFNLDNLKIAKCILNSWNIKTYIEEKL
ncbi:MAG: hypothetical protein ABIO44_08145 [Saprospiraceae bacterium]